MMQKKFLKNGIKNMEYKIFLTSKAQSEIETIFDYIADELKNKQAAIRLKNRFKEKIGSLRTMAKKYQIIENINRVEKVYRRIVIDNFIILYTIDDEKK